MITEEAFDFALNETVYCFAATAVSKDDFLSTFETFYDETMAENEISDFPENFEEVRQHHKSRAVEIWADDFSDW